MGKVLQIREQHALVKSIKANDQMVLKTLYQQNYKKVEVYVLQNSGSVAQAKDVYQEAFLAMYQNVKAEKFTPENETALQGYLYQISKNKWRDILRSSVFKKTSSLENNFYETEDQSEEYKNEIELEEQDKLKKTMDAFSKLGAECKELLLQFYFQKKSLREISSNANYAEASARNKKYRCIQKLKELAQTPK
ncbi:RNA polymerase sigma factor [Jejudonia soesokkakensis]|uniref:RNA polymerase sigma factor n=1 Tax=Jejudonia soesokkakensis TaxID=1323432 RepID=A0ABW2MSW7_9FLAO